MEQLKEIFYYLVGITNFAFLIFIIIKLKHMSTKDTKVEADVASLKTSLDAITAKLNAIATDSENLLSDQSQADLDTVTAGFKALSDSLTPPPAPGA
jgi:uncharacterized protein YoxC